MVKTSRSIKLLKDIDLQNSEDGSSEAMMIVAFGKSFSVSDSNTKETHHEYIG